METTKGIKCGACISYVAEAGGRVFLLLWLAAPCIVAASDARPVAPLKLGAKQPAQIIYHKTLEKALKAAQKSKRPVLVYFHAA